MNSYNNTRAALAIAMLASAAGGTNMSGPVSIPIPTTTNSGGHIRSARTWNKDRGAKAIQKRRNHRKFAKISRRKNR